MDKNVQVMVGTIAIALVICYIIHVSSEANRNQMRDYPITINQNFITVNYTPISTTNIETLAGNGHTIGNENQVENVIS